MRRKVWVPGHWSHYYDKYDRKKRKWVKGYWKVVDVSKRRWRW